MRSLTRFFTAALLSIAAITVSSPDSRQSWTLKLDRAIRVAAARGTSSCERVLVRVAAGPAPGTIIRLEQTIGSRLTATTTPDLYVAQVAEASIGALARRSEVLRVSTDAPVVSLG